MKAAVKRRAALAGLLLGSAACGGPAVPECSDPATEELVLTRSYAALWGTASRARGRAIRFDPERDLYFVASDSAAYSVAGGTLILRSPTGSDSMRVLSLRGVHAVSQDEATGSWQCAGEIQHLSARDSAGFPVRFTSGLAEGGVHTVSGETKGPARPVAF